MTGRSLRNNQTAQRRETHGPANGPGLRILIAGLLVLFVAGAGGCELFGIVVHAFFPEKIKARYRLDDRPTLVLVDDSAAAIGNPALINLIAHTLADDLLTKKVLAAGHAVPTGKLYELAARLGNRYGRTPIDQIGTELGAQQVIHVDVKSIRLLQEPGLYRPVAAVHVKVIDAQKGKKLFPQQPDETTAGGSLNRQHETVIVALRRSTVRSGEQAETQLILQKLSERIGHEVAKMFYDHLPRQPGEPFDD